MKEKLEAKFEACNRAKTIFSTQSIGMRHDLARLRIRTIRLIVESDTMSILPPHDSRSCGFGFARKLEELNRRHLGGVAASTCASGEIIPVREEMDDPHLPMQDLQSRVALTTAMLRLPQVPAARSEAYDDRCERQQEGAIAAAGIA